MTLLAFLPLPTARHNLIAGERGPSALQQVNSYNYLTLRKPILPQAQRTYQANVCYCASFNGSTYLVWGNSRIIISNKRAAALSESTRAYTHCNNYVLFSLAIGMQQ